MMENLETVLEEIEKHERNEFKEELSATLDDYLRFIAKTGDPIFPWHRIKNLLRHKLSSVMGEFFETYGGEDAIETCNTPSFAYAPTKVKILQHFDSFIGAPFTIQRLCEILMDPIRHYKRTDKFLRGIEKNILVVSIVEPGHAKRMMDQQLVNGMQDPVESDEMRDDLMNGGVTSNGVSNEDTSSSSSSSCSSSTSSSPTPDEDPHESGPTPKRPRLESPTKEIIQERVTTSEVKEKVDLDNNQDGATTETVLEEHTTSLQETADSDSVLKKLHSDIAHKDITNLVKSPEGLSDEGSVIKDQCLEPVSNDPNSESIPVDEIINSQTEEVSVENSEVVNEKPEAITSESLNTDEVFSEDVSLENSQATTAEDCPKDSNSDTTELITDESPQVQKPNDSEDSPDEELSTQAEEVDTSDAEPKDPTHNVSSTPTEVNISSTSKDTSLKEVESLATLDAPSETKEEDGEVSDVDHHKSNDNSTDNTSNSDEPTNEVTKEVPLKETAVDNITSASDSCATMEVPEENSSSNT